MKVMLQIRENSNSSDTSPLLRKSSIETSGLRDAVYPVDGPVSTLHDESSSAERNHCSRIDRIKRQNKLINQYKGM